MAGGVTSGSCAELGAPSGARGGSMELTRLPRPRNGRSKAPLGLEGPHGAEEATSTSPELRKGRFCMSLRWTEAAAASREALWTR